MNRTLWFIAILPPDDVAGRIRTVQQEIADRFGPRRALKLPPHITVESPFRYEDANAEHLLGVLGGFFAGQTAFSLTLRNFGSFRDDVVFIEVDPCLQLLEIHGQLSVFLRGDAGIIREPPFHEGYTPHLTVANRDVTPHAHHLIWQEFNTRRFFAEFAVGEMCLMRHDENVWQVHARYKLTEKTDG